MAISFASFRFPATKACSLLIIDADLCRRKLRNFEPIAHKLIKTLDRDPTDPRISQALKQQAETRMSIRLWNFRNFAASVPASLNRRCRSGWRGADDRERN